MTRREFVTTSLIGAAALGMGACSPPSKKLMLIRYDAESRQKEEIAGFFEKMMAVHRAHEIPASFFCLGAAMELREADFDRSFDVHERLHGSRPIGVSLAGTGSRDGERLSGFDSTEKSRAELDMLASLDLTGKLALRSHSRIHRSLCSLLMR